MNPKVLKAGILVIVVAAVGAIMVLREQPPCGCTMPPLPSNSEVTGNAVSESNDPVAAQKLPRMIDLGRGTCIPCKAMAPILKEAKEEYKGRADIEFIDVGENPDQAQKYQIRLIPTQVFFDAEGKEVWRHEGFLSKEDIAKKLAEMGVK
jgi:thioredoxin 1